MLIYTMLIYFLRGETEKIMKFVDNTARTHLLHTDARQATIGFPIFERLEQYDLRQLSTITNGSLRKWRVLHLILVG